MPKTDPFADLDEIDHGILAALQNNARLSNKELAREVGLSPSACLERVRRLGRRQVLLGYHAAVNPAAFGIGLSAMMAIKMRDSDRGAFQSLIDHLMDQDEVIAVYELAGQDDLLAHVVCRDASHLRDFVADAMGQRPELGQYVTSLVFEHHQKRGLPDFR